MCRKGFNLDGTLTFPFYLLTFSLLPHYCPTDANWLKQAGVASLTESCKVIVAAHKLGCSEEVMYDHEDGGGATDESGRKISKKEKREKALEVLRGCTQCSWQDFKPQQSHGLMHVSK